MKHLENIEEVGKGIAVAFVATVYGVGSANIFFLPAANKLKARAHRTLQLRELVLEGVIGIVEGLNPKLLRIKLEAYSREHAGVQPAPARRSAAARRRNGHVKAVGIRDMARKKKHPGHENHERWLCRTPISSPCCSPSFW
jgi:chemotaxis protein MotA